MTTLKRQQRPRDQQNERSARIDPWRVGDELSAEHLDQPRQYLESQSRGNRGPLQIAFDIPQLVMARVKIVSVQNDYLVCKRDSAPSGSVSVAKPFQLRASITSRGGITYTYSDAQSREADDGAATENQVIVPSYLANDYICIVGPLVEGTGVSDAPRWLDLNVDGRAWAKEAT